MKVGFRTSSLKKSFKTRTTSRYKRQLKSTIDPTYGKKGVGWLKNPRKALYNKTYNKAIKSIFDIFR